MKPSVDLWFRLEMLRQETVNSKPSDCWHRKVQGGGGRAVDQASKGGELEGGIPGERVHNSPGFAGWGPGPHGSLWNPGCVVGIMEHAQLGLKKGVRREHMGGSPGILGWEDRLGLGTLFFAPPSCHPWSQPLLLPPCLLWFFLSAEQFFFAFPELNRRGRPH